MQKINNFITTKFDILVAILLGITSVTTAFCAFTGGLWNSTSSSSYSKAITQLSEANTSYLEYNNAHLEHELRDLKLDLQKANKEQKSELEAETQNTTDELKKDYDAKWDAHEALMQKADFANSTSDKFALVTVIYAIVLFLGSLAMQSKKQNLKNYYLLVTAAIFAVATAYLASLPMPFFGE